MGLTAAALARTHARGRLAAQVELAWTRTRATRDGTAYSLDALQLPVAAHARLWRGDALDIGALAGAALELRLDRAIGGAAVDRLGADAVAGLDAELTGVPLRFELRGAVGLTTLGSAGRGWALGASVGVLLF